MGADEAVAPWDVVADALRDRQPRLGALMDASREDVRAEMDFPKGHSSQIESTNPLERVNREIERRSDVIGVFPNNAAIIRLVGAQTAQGLGGLGAKTGGTDFSRPGVPDDWRFGRFDFNYRRPLGEQASLRLRAAGQYAVDPLPGAVPFSGGGDPYDWAFTGRGIAADKGAATAIEATCDVPTGHDGSRAGSCADSRTMAVSGTTIQVATSSVTMLSARSGSASPAVLVPSA